jgi:NADH:ubiquinone oxidoreductase subunit C
MFINKEKFNYLIANKPNTFFKILVDDITIKPFNLVTISALLKSFNYQLITATSIDSLAKYNRFNMHYIYISHLVAQRVYIALNTNLKVSSIIQIFPSAIWLEREIFDLYGIYFDGNGNSNDLRRLLTDYHFKGHPLRKDFTLIGYNERHYSYQTKSIKNRRNVIF